MPILLKSLLSELLIEGPEYFGGFRYDHSKCIGPFIIFKHKDNNESHYVFSDIVGFHRNGEIQSDSVWRTHSGLCHAYAVEFSEFLNSKDYETIHGRIWFIQDRYIISTWSTYEEIEKYGISSFLYILDDLLKNHLNVNTKEVLYNPYEEFGTKGSDKVYSYEEFKNGGQKKDIITTDDRELLKKLHLMDPEHKADSLKSMGIKSKVSDTPDFQKRQLAGLDETISHNSSNKYYYRIHPKGDIFTVLRNGLYSYSPSESPGAYIDAPDMNRWPDQDDNDFETHRFYVANNEWNITDDRFQIRIPEENLPRLEKDHLGDYYIDTKGESELIVEPKQFDIKIGGRWVRADLVDRIMEKYWRRAHHKKSGYYKNKFYDDEEDENL